MPAASGSSFDHHGWVQRALRFLDHVAHIEDVEVRSRVVGAPDPAAGAGGLSVPPTVAEFLRSGAGSLDLSYIYEPVDQGQDDLMEIFPGQNILYGGARVCSAEEMAEATRYVRDWARDVWGDDDPAQREIWEHALPFAMIDNGDYLALDLRTGAADPPVVYLNHEEESFLLAPSFTAFLAAWERLCYVGPEHWLLGEFRGDDSYLDPDSDRAAALRSLLGEPSETP